MFANHTSLSGPSYPAWRSALSASKDSDYQRQYVHGNLALVKTTTLDYNGGKLPVKTVAVSSNGVTETALYTYVGENISRSERTFTSSIAAPQVTVINYQHDDIPSPFYGLLYGPPSPEAINRNNIKYDGNERIYNSQELLTNLNTNVNGPAIGPHYLRL